MKSDNVIHMAICPLCGKPYGDAREDNKTRICPDCGTRQALESIGVAAEEREQILATTHRSMRC